MLPLQLAFEPADQAALPQKTCANEILAYPADVGCTYGSIKCLCQSGPHQKLRRALISCMDEYCSENRAREAEASGWLLKLGCQA
jgi:hypothetical protein